MLDIESDQLTDLLAAAEREHLALGCAEKSALLHAMAAGDALLAARALVPHGQWESFIRTRTSISARSARIYIQVAKARPLLNRQSSADLSIATALKYLKGSKPKKSRSRSSGRDNQGQAFPKGTAVIRKALSLAQAGMATGISDAVASSNVYEAVAALSQLNVMLATAGADLHDIEIRIMPAAAGKARPRAA